MNEWYQFMKRLHNKQVVTEKKLLKCKSTVNGITWYKVVYKLIESCNTSIVIFYETKRRTIPGKQKTIHSIKLYIYSGSNLCN